ncbi:MAG: hypothetical protein HOE69_06365 [Euryarchaeota archaeon]|jgi:uncharacterized coiled-coil DUF342 family protein|nr:hypothetical protein [Euryarchaeota archaeon]
MSDDAQNSKPQKNGEKNRGQKGRGGKGRGKKGNRRDFFEDLRELESHQIEDMLSDNKASARSIESQLESLESERASLISTVQVLRTALYSSGGISKERRELLTELKARNIQINEIKENRDSINERVSPPLKLIERLLKRTWRDLTTIREDPSKAPNLPNEIQKFSFFFELKEMHKLKMESDASHIQFVDLIRKQKETIKKLDGLQDESTGIAEKATDENPRLAGTTISRKEEKVLNDRIEKMLDVIRTQRRELRRLKREIGRLDSYLRIRVEDERRGRKVRKRINTLREHAMSGGTLSMEDMARILETGGLSQLQQSQDNAAKKGKKSDRKRGGRRKTQPRRGTTRSYQRREE